MSLQGKYIQVANDSFDPSLNQLSVGELPVESYEGLLFRFSGTNDTSQTFDISAMGDLQVTDGDRYDVRVPFNFLDDYTQKKFGIMDRASTTAGAVSWYVYYPFNFPNDVNTIFRVPNNRKVRVFIFPTTTLDTNITGNITVTVLGIMKTGIMPYRLRYNRRDIAIVNGRVEENIDLENVVAVYIENNTNLSRVLYFQDGAQVVDAVRDNLISMTHIDNRLETFSSTFPWVELNFNRNNSISTIKNTNNLLKLEGTSGDTVTAIILSLDYTPDFLQSTLQEFEAEKANQNRRKVETNQTRPVVVEQILQG